MRVSGFFKGTSAEQDRRFSDKELKLLKSMKFPPTFDKKVDMRKVNLDVIKPWIAKQLTEMNGVEDDVVVEYVQSLLEDKADPTPDPKKMQINLTGFLTTQTAPFMISLWDLLLEAQESIGGVPKRFIEEKKEEMRRAGEGDRRAIGERDRRGFADSRGGDGGRSFGDRDGGRGGYGGGRGDDRGRGFRGRGRGRGRGGYGGDDRDRARDGGWGGRGGVSSFLDSLFAFCRYFLFTEFALRLSGTLHLRPPSFYEAFPLFMHFFHIINDYSNNHLMCIASTLSIKITTTKSSSSAPFTFEVKIPFWV
ncbi:hypothetical protein JAAARDRAFT_128886 [Jaapia argillacea MUCL 33604]|uniref:PWI domain-containing protein n=1 Tax=Jaapia argillacea MUCL 33604 TaxID=933084 RepID=A0A067PUI9_9AGAM|nr:hypothetical protein JAAARDRAFT_128886 [Jaapia argillacea MUCL 33604]